MANKTGNKRHLTTALLGGDHFSRQGIAAILKNMVPEMQVIASSDDYSLMETVFLTTPLMSFFYPARKSITRDLIA